MHLLSRNGKRTEKASNEVAGNTKRDREAGLGHPIKNEDKQGKQVMEGWPPLPTKEVNPNTNVTVQRTVNLGSKA